MKPTRLFMFVILVLACCSPLNLTETQTLQGNTNTAIPSLFIPQDWLNYNNKFLKYSFHYPQEATIIEEGVTGFPSDELPPGTNISGYFDQLKAIYPSNLCVRVHFAGTFLSITPPDDRGGKYTGPCGISGIGNTYTSEKFEETIYMAGDYRTVTWTRLLDRSSGEWQHEFSTLRIDDFLLEFGVFTFMDVDKISENEFIQAKPDLLLILASLEWSE